ncbi:MAG: type II secretion system F family protein [Gammaproteobacteria bacterium]
MFSDLPSVPVLLVALSMGSLLWVLISVWMTRDEVGHENWRDRPPLFFKLLSPFVGIIIKKVEASQSPFQLEVVQDKLDAAGMAYALRPAEVIATRRVGFAFGIFMFLYCFFVLKPEKMSTILLVGMFIPFGYFYPDMWLRDMVKKRHAHIEKQFPFFLDLLVLTMRAGLNFSSAMAHSVDKMTEGPVRQEFSQFLREVRTGARRREALERLGRRINLSSVNNFVSAVNQAEEIGGELGPILTSQAKQRRAERFLRAEKLANQAPVKMMLPLIGVLFPMMFIIIGFPIFIKGRDQGAMGFFGG